MLQLIPLPVIIHYLLFSIAANRSRSFTLSGNSNMAVSAMVGGGSQGTPNSCVRVKIRHLFHVLPYNHENPLKISQNNRYNIVFF